ncbi:Hypothetical_protein [Hexamita inflata]|uniref:Hypothetical_protein n=1 Tax=Hexamita inflata TaxID=28002 RepID=A0AA86UGX1_9EUKA|nr:Hypothetical protein HINF_LOCUS38312 [Hexamita inflata]
MSIPNNNSNDYDGIVLTHNGLKSKPIQNKAIEKSLDNDTISYSSPMLLIQQQQQYAISSNSRVYKKQLQKTPLAQISQTNYQVMVQSNELTFSETLGTYDPDQELQVKQIFVDIE